MLQRLRASTAGRIGAVSASQLYTIGASALILVLTARWLGPEGRGLIASTTTWVTLLATLSGLSLGQVAIYRGSQSPIRDQLPGMVGTLVAFAVAAGVLVWSVVALLYGVGKGDWFRVPAGLFAVALVGLPFLIAEQYASPMLLLTDRTRTYNRILIAGRTVQLGLVVAAWLARTGVATVVAAGVAVQIVLACLSIRALRESCSAPPRFDRALLGRWLRDGVRLHANYLSDLLLTNASVLIINYYLGARATGIYHTALAMLAVPMVLPQAAAMVMLGRLGMAGRIETWREQRRHLVILVAIAVLGVVLCAILTPVLVPLVLGSRFAESTRLLQLLSLTFVSGTIFRVMHPQWIARGLFTTMSLVTFGMGLVNVAGHLLLVPRFETMGAAASMLASHAFGLGAQAWLILRCERELAGQLQPAQTVP